MVNEKTSVIISIFAFEMETTRGYHRTLEISHQTKQIFYIWHLNGMAQRTLRVRLDTNANIPYPTYSTLLGWLGPNHSLDLFWKSIVTTIQRPQLLLIRKRSIIYRTETISPSQVTYWSSPHHLKAEILFIGNSSDKKGKEKRHK